MASTLDSSEERSKGDIPICCCSFNVLLKPPDAPQSPGPNILFLSFSNKLNIKMVVTMCSSFQGCFLKRTMLNPEEWYKG